MNNQFNIKHYWKNHPVNIGHFVHDNLFYAIVEYIKDNSIKWILDNDLSEWEYNITKIIIDYLNINYEINNTGIDTSFPKCDRNIKKNEHYNEVIDLIRKSVNNKYNLKENCIEQITHKVLYLRNDATRRKMVNYNDELNYLFDDIVVDMGSKTFEEQVKLFNKTTHFVTIEGAHLTNIIFMNPSTKILIFSPTKNSWQEKFGTSTLVNHFEIKTTGGKDFNSNIDYNDNIKTKIINFLS